MNKAAVYNQTGEKVSDLDLNPKIFGLEKLDANLVQMAVIAQRTNARRSIAHTKNRGEVSGTGKKPWKQKGTGRARAGSFRSPLWRHGGITFGPRSEVDWSVKLNRSAFRKALFTVLSDKINDKKLIIVDKLETVSKTKELAGMLTRIADRSGLGKKFVLVISAHNKELERAASNLPNTKVLVANQLNVFDLMKHDAMITKDALSVIEKTYLK
jgi:large subunit ribosomal protein L4